MQAQSTSAGRRSEHEIIVRTKLGSGYTTNDGRVVPSHTLYICDCACGYRGAAWFASRERAEHVHARHLGTVR